MERVVGVVPKLDPQVLTQSSQLQVHRRLRLGGGPPAGELEGVIATEIGTFFPIYSGGTHAAPRLAPPLLASVSTNAAPASRPMPSARAMSRSVNAPVL